MAYIHFDSSYAPCGFLIVRADGNPYKDSDTVLIQSDWDFPSVAQAMGWGLNATSQCEHDGTDGTVTCPECGKSASEFISEAYDFIRDHEGDEFPALNDYLKIG